MTEQGLRKLTQLAANYSHGYMIWFGPITLMIVFCHPDMLRSITNASGTQAELVVVGAMTHLRDSSSSLPTFDVAPTGPWPLLPSLAQPFPPFFHIFISPHFTVSFFLTLLSIPHSGALLKDVPISGLRDGTGYP